jgi:hypothetical protein
MPPRRLPIVNADDGTWGDIIRQYLMKEHYNDDTDNTANGGHQKITIRPGTAAAGTAPLKFTSGTLLSTPEAGAVEFNGDNLYFTQTSGTTRKKLAAYDDASGATGDVYYRNSSGQFTRLAAGSTGDLLTIASGIPSWTADIVGKALDNTNTITVKDTNFTLQDDGDATKQLQFQLSGISTGTTRTLTIPNASGTIYVTGSTDVSVADGGTGRSTNTTAYGIIAAGTTATGAMQTIAPGTSGQFLKSAGASALASFASIQLSDLSDSSSVVTLTGTQTLTNKTLAAPTVTGNPNFTGQPVMGDYAYTSPTLHLKGGSGGNPILQMSRGTGSTASSTFDFALAGGGFSIRDVDSGYISLNTFASGSNVQAYIGQSGSQGNYSSTTATLSASTHQSSAGSNIGGPNLIIQGGGGTGSGSPGDIQFKTFSATTSGSTAQSSTVRATIEATTGVMTIANPGTVAGSVVSIDGTQTLSNKTLTTPTIASFTNATHTHTNAAGGGQLDATTALDATGTKSSSTFLRGDNTWATPPNTTYSEIPSAEITAGTASTARAISGRRAQEIVDKAVAASGDVTLSGVQTLTNKTINADNNTLTNIELNNFKASAIITESESIGSNDNDTTLPTSAAVKDYADSVGSNSQAKFMTGTTATAGATTAKTVTLDAPWTSYTPVAGDWFIITYTSGQTASSPTLAINGGTAYPIRTPHDSGTNSSNTYASNGASHLLLFDGSSYRLPGATYNTTYSAIADAEIINTGSTAARLITGQRAETLMANEATNARTLTNKTLTGPRIDQVNDTNGNNILDYVAIGSAVNRFYMTNQSVGNYPTFGVDGSDTNIGFTLAPKGNGPVRLFAGAGITPTIDVAGPDTNIDLNLKPKGSGTVTINGVDVVTLTASQTLSNKTLTTPTIASFTNATHTHTNAAGGGQLTPSTALSATGTPSSSTYLRGDNTWATIATGGDASTNTATSIDGEVALFSGTGGKTLRRATATGIATLTSGVLSTTATTGSGNVVLATSPTITTPVLNGTITGTGVATAATANLIPKWDANKNLFADNFIATFTTTATAAGTTTLTVASTQIQVFTGTSTQTVRLPTTSVIAGTQYRIINNSTGAVTVQSSGANTITVLAGGTSGLFTALQAAPTTAAHWDPQYWGSFIASGKALNISNSLTLAGTDSTTMTFPSSSDTVVTLTASQTLSNKTLTTPTIASFTNATHTHTNAAGGGQLDATTALDATGTKSSSTFLRGDNTWATPPNTTYSEIPSAEITAGTASTARAISGRRAQEIVDKAVAASGDVTLSGVQTLTNKTLSSPIITSTAELNGTIDYTPDSGNVLTFDGTPVITRHLGGQNKSIGIGGDDTVIIGGGESRATIAANVNLASETVEIGGETGVNIYVSTDNWADWANRKTTAFTSTGITWDGNQVWHAGNDGSGSGLDADTLDGLNSTSFLRADSNDTKTGYLSSTGYISTTSYVEAGRGSGSIALTANDGYGNANIAFNHNSGVPDQDGNAARIEVNTDAAGGAAMYFELGSNVTNGVETGLTSTLVLTETSMTFSGSTVWHAGNDGSGSGLDADLLDGMNATSANTGSTIVARDSNGDINVRYANSTYANMSHTVATRNSDTVFYSSTDNYIRKNTATGFKTSLSLENVDNTSDATKNSAAATLTNKTLTSPIINGTVLGSYSLNNPVINAIADTNGNFMLTFYAIPSAVNFLTIANATSGSSPLLWAQGSATNIGLMLRPKGSGTIDIYAESGQTPTIQAVGASVNNDLNLKPGGTGKVKVSGTEVVTISDSQTLTNKNFTSGTNTFPTFNQDTTGNAATATALQTSRTFRTNLASTSTASFNGTANVTPGVTGTLPVANGGTGATTLTGIVVGNGTAAFSTVTAPSGAIVGTTDTQTLSGKTLTTPTIASFTNATHNHTNAAGGGQLNATTALNASGTPSSSTYLRGDNTWATMAAGGDASTNTSSSVDSEVALFAGTGGKTLKRATGTGLAKLVSGVLSIASSGTDYVTPDGAETLTNKRIDPRIGSITSSSTPSINTNIYDQYNITALATNISSLSAAGSPVEGQKIIIRIKDNGSPRSIVWSASWRGMGVSLPVVTTASKTLYIGAIYNSTDGIWDVIAVEQQA